MRARKCTHTYTRTQRVCVFACEFACMCMCEERELVGIVNAYVDKACIRWCKLPPTYLCNVHATYLATGMYYRGTSSQRDARRYGMTGVIISVGKPLRQISMIYGRAISAIRITLKLE